jgi:formamidopyrimidine-DNA glycosylase
MPEGPEVWILSEAINKYYSYDKTKSVGKHLIIKDTSKDWSFGLTGRVEIDDKDELHKLDFGWLYGTKDDYNDNDNDNKAIDWMQTNKTELENVINKWKTSKKMLGTLLLDQSNIMGIGVAWGSEILFEANLKPNVKTCEQAQSLHKLVDAMLEIRKTIKSDYKKELTKHKTKENIKKFINGWYNNLYEIRKMNVYKKGKKIQVAGRSWWI